MCKNKFMKNTFGLTLKDKYGNRIVLWQAKSGQIFIGFNEGIPLSFVNIVEGKLETFLRDIEDFNELKFKKYYHLK